MWATKHIAIVAAKDMNRLVVKVESACDGKEVTVWTTIGEAEYYAVFVYAHGSDSAYREKQIARLWLNRRVPHVRSVADSWACLLEPLQVKRYTVPMAVCRWTTSTWIRYPRR